MNVKASCIVLATVALLATGATATSAAAGSAAAGSAAIGSAVTSSAARAAVTSVPRPDHVVLVIFENKGYSQINGAPAAAYFNTLASQGAKFTQSFAVTHPSQPNYIALFSGSPQGVTNDNCPKNFTNRANLGSQLIAAGDTFTGYSESMPSNGYTGCTSGTYARKHNAWVDFNNVPAADNLTYASFPTDFTTLPTVAFVAPNLCNDMHDCSIATGNTWLQSHMSSYVTWAQAHNSLLIVTFDENDGSSGNQVFTVFVGAHVKVGNYAETINHYNILRTLEDAYGLTPLNNAATAASIADCWQ